MSPVERAEASLMAVIELLRQHRAVFDHATPSHEIAMLEARGHALNGELHYERTVESLASYKRSLCREPERRDQPFTAADLAGWQPPVFAPLGSESRHDR